MDSTFEQFKEEVKRLNALIDNPQPGLFTWHEALNDTMRRIKELYYGNGAKNEV